MARTRAFDTDEVVRAAREVFWTWGYDAAAMPELERSTGLGRSSLYNAFGSKRGLFDAAVQSYLDEVVRPRLAALAAAPTGAEGLRGYFDSIAEAVLGSAGGQQRGCLLLAAASGRSGQDDEVRSAVDAYRAEVTGAFAAALLRDVPAAGDGASAARVADGARLLFALLTAGMALARINGEEAAATLRAAADFTGPLAPC
ncbi:TetR/AcrR family transcriptional regulator [Arthrobacter sp. JSM 101049]|uniref:TetR/AcrR family transcriptional regulator n=1 Tax=Arthrobacter sp. JSM 101049 TaxID=929097 RepID=UPI003567D966